MDKHIIRENAGKLWRLLSTDVHRKWNLQEVKELTGFNDLEVASAAGSLVRTRFNSSLNTTTLRIRTHYYTLC